MKAFLLAAGHGTRLRPITNTIPKCLVPIRGIPLLSIWLELCRKFGIHEVLINVHAHAALVSDFLRENANGIRAQVVEEEELLGSAGTLRHNRGWIEEEELFWVFYADVLCQPDLGEMLRTASSKGGQPQRSGFMRYPIPVAVESYLRTPME